MLILGWFLLNFECILGGPVRSRVAKKARKNDAKKKHEQMSKTNVSRRRNDTLLILFLAMSKSKASMIDLKLIDQASGEAWSAPQNSVEWFKIARELIELGVTVGNNEKWDPHFFRYGTLSLWSELVRQQGVCAEDFTHKVTSDSTEVLHFLDQWQVILSLADYINHDGVRDIISM